MYTSAINLNKTFLNKRMSEHFEVPFIDKQYYGRFVLNFFIELATKEHEGFGGIDDNEGVENEENEVNKKTPHISCKDNYSNYYVTTSLMDFEKAKSMQKVIGRLQEEEAQWKQGKSGLNSSPSGFWGWWKAFKSALGI